MKAVDGKSVVIYTTSLCGFCFAAKSLLDNKGVAFKEVAVDGDHETRQALMQETGQRTVPQIWIGRKHVGGFTDLAELEQSQALDAMLAELTVG